MPWSVYNDFNLVHLHTQKISTFAHVEAGYTIKIKHFEGPFELLMFFIERDELNINDIPIAKITNDFLKYIRSLDRLNLDVASEFILMAATLMRIKAKMLIPRKQLDEDGNEIDPRQDLIQKLLEYKRFKDILGDLQVLEADQSSKHPRGDTPYELGQIATRALVDLELESLSLFKLMNAFHKSMERFADRKDRKVHEIVSFRYTVQSEQKNIYQKLSIAGKLDFRAMFENLENRVHAIVSFLALLELINTQMISFTEREGVNNFWLEPGVKVFSEEITEEE